MPQHLSPDLRREKKKEDIQPTLGNFIIGLFGRFFGEHCIQHLAFNGVSKNIAYMPVYAPYMTRISTYMLYKVCPVYARICTYMHVYALKLIPVYARICTYMHVMLRICSVYAPYMPHIFPYMFSMFVFFFIYLGSFWGTFRNSLPSLRKREVTEARPEKLQPEVQRALAAICYVYVIIESF